MAATGAACFGLLSLAARADLYDRDVVADIAFFNGRASPATGVACAGRGCMALSGVPLGDRGRGEESSSADPPRALVLAAGDELAMGTGWLEAIAVEECCAWPTFGQEYLCSAKG